MAKIEEASVSDEMFAEIIDEEMGEIDRELGLVGGFDALDDEMKGMLDAVDAVIEAERDGDLERARKNEAIDAALGRGSALSARQGDRGGTRRGTEARRARRKAE
jgi:hypothetical protein